MLPDATLPVPSSVVNLLAVLFPLRPGSPGPPGCARTPHSASCRPSGPGSPAGPAPRLPSLDKLAATSTWQPVTTTRYRTTAAVQAAVITCLWAPHPEL